MTLTEMREAKGLSQTEAQRRCLKVESKFPATAAALSAIERRGTTDYWHLRALALVYEQDLHVVAQAARPDGGAKRDSFGRGRRVFAKNI